MRRRGLAEIQGEWVVLSRPALLKMDTLLHAFFLPQHSYVPLGSLRHALLYPDEGAGVDNGILTATLEEVGLGRFAGERAASGGVVVAGHDPDVMRRFSRLDGPAGEHVVSLIPGTGEHVES